MAAVQQVSLCDGTFGVMHVIDAKSLAFRNNNSESYSFRGVKQAALPETSCLATSLMLPLGIE